MITKLDALRALDGIGSENRMGITVTRFTQALRRRGFELGGTWHAHTILVRLKRQGLARSAAASQRLVSSTSAFEPTQRRRVVLWEITDRGRGRADWLEGRKSPRKAIQKAANPRGRRGKKG